MKIIVTGSSGFIGFHVSKKLLGSGNKVHGIDSMNNYYDVNLKKARLAILKKYKNFSFSKAKIENSKDLGKAFKKFKPSVVIHLAAQAGVRYSIEKPRVYLDSNITGTYNIIEISKKLNVKHLIMASSSSVYGANKKIPFKEIDKTETQMSIYAATKKSCEIMSHSFSHIHNLPITNFRFFTVYGPWGRPDMALFKFVKAIKENKPINVYNNGLMKRDFTYISDLVKAISLLINCIPEKGIKKTPSDSLSEVAPWRVVNIGNSSSQNLTDFISEIENNLDCKAHKNFMPMQKGDVKETFADCKLLFELTGFKPNTPLREGIKKFCDWYEIYYKNN